MIWQIVSVILYLNFKTSYSVITNHVQFARYLDLENRNDDRFTLSTASASNQVECAKLCKSSQGCESFFFNKLTETCDLKSVLYIHQGDTVSEEGTVNYYVVKDEASWCPESQGYVLGSTDGPCLKFHGEVDELRNWYDANQTCNDEFLSSRLLVVDSQEKMDDVAVAAGNEGISAYTYFIGLSEISENIYRWVDGSSLTFTPAWHTADYSTPETEDCVHVMPATWKWVKSNCNMTRRFICELTANKTTYQGMMNFP